jgi:hypothetical protein
MWLGVTDERAVEVGGGLGLRGGDRGGASGKDRRLKSWRERKGWV